MSGLVNHNGRVTGPEQIKASDMLKLVSTIDAAAGLYNALEQLGHSSPEYDALGEKLRELGLREVT